MNGEELHSGLGKKKQKNTLMRWCGRYRHFAENSSQKAPVCCRCTSPASEHLDGREEAVITPSQENKNRFTFSFWDPKEKIHHSVIHVDQSRESGQGRKPGRIKEILKSNGCCQNMKLIYSCMEQRADSLCVCVSVIWVHEQ